MQTKIEKISPLSALAIKNIDEVSQNGTDFLSFREKLSFANISHPEKKKEWATARIAIHDSLQTLQIPYPGFFKDEHGKSHSMNGQGFVSLTHTPGYAGAIFHRENPVGIDMDLIREKILRIGFRFLDAAELDFLEQDPAHYTMAWSAKESIFKCQGRRGVSLKNHIRLNPFTLEDKVISGRVENTEFSDHHYKVKIEWQNDIVLTYTVW